MKTVLIIISCVSLLLFPANLVAQETASDSGQQGSLTDKIKQRLEQTTEENLDDIKNELLTKTNTPKRKAFIGQVQAVNQSLITLGYKGSSYQLEVTDNTDYSQTSLDKLAIDDFVIAMGLVFPGSEKLIVHKLSYVDTPALPKTRQLLIGKIKEIDNNKITVNAKTITVASATDLTIKGIDKPTVEDLELDDNLFAIVTLDKDGDIDTVKTIFIIPGKNNTASLTPTNATASAESSESAKTE